MITDVGKRIDLRAIDRQADLCVIELKKDKTPGEVVAQALEYGYWVQSLSFEPSVSSTPGITRATTSPPRSRHTSRADLPEAVNTSGRSAARSAVSQYRP